MSYYKPHHIFFNDSEGYDPEAARQHVGVARQFLFKSEQLQDFGDKKFLKRKKVLKDGTLIEIVIINNIRKIFISTPGKLYLTSAGFVHYPRTGSSSWLSDTSSGSALLSASGDDISLDTSFEVNCSENSYLFEWHSLDWKKQVLFTTYSVGRNIIQPKTHSALFIATKEEGYLAEVGLSGLDNVCGAWYHEDVLYVATYDNATYKITIHAHIDNVWEEQDSYISQENVDGEEYANWHRGLMAKASHAGDRFVVLDQKTEGEAVYDLLVTFRISSGTVTHDTELVTGSQRIPSNNDGSVTEVTSTYTVPEYERCVRPPVCKEWERDFDTGLFECIDYRTDEEMEDDTICWIVPERTYWLGVTHITITNFTLNRVIAFDFDQRNDELVFAKEKTSGTTRVVSTPNPDDYEQSGQKVWQLFVGDLVFTSVGRDISTTDGTIPHKNGYYYGFNELDLRVGAFMLEVDIFNPLYTYESLDGCLLNFYHWFSKRATLCSRSGVTFDTGPGECLFPEEWHCAINSKGYALLSESDAFQIINSDGNPADYNSNECQVDGDPAIEDGYFNQDGSRSYLFSPKGTLLMSPQDYRDFYAEHEDGPIEEDMTIYPIFVKI